VSPVSSFLSNNLDETGEGMGGREWKWLQEELELFVINAI